MTTHNICFCREIRKKKHVDLLLLWSYVMTALDKTCFLTKKILVFFLFLQHNICCGYSLELPFQGNSNEYPQLIFLWNVRRNYGKLVLTRTL